MAKVNSEFAAQLQVGKADVWMEGGGYKQAFYLYNTAREIYEKMGDAQNQRSVLKKMMAAAEGMGNSGLAQQCRKALVDDESDES